jgi:hypothetical protein
MALLLLGCSSLKGQTVVKGQVKDAQSNEPVPFANVVLLGTEDGATTDFDGYYTVRSTASPDSIRFSFMGYDTKTLPIQTGQTQTLNVTLQPSTQELEEVVVKPGRNPALVLLDSLDRRRDSLNKTSLEAYQYEAYSRVEVSIDNISEEFRNRKIMKPFGYVFDSLQVAAGPEGEMVLPIFVSETLSDYYHLGQGDQSREVVKANKIKGVGINEDSYITQFVGASFQEYNFYNSYLGILDKEFISPLAPGGKTFYKYYLDDSLMLDGRHTYVITFEPKRPQDLAFRGKMWIQDTTYALKRIDAKVTGEANVNFLEKLQIQQDMTQTEAGPWLPRKTRVQIDVAEPTGKSFGMLGSFYLSHRDIQVNDPKPKSFYNNEVKVRQNARQPSEAYWNEARHDSLSRVERNLYGVIDSIRNFPQVKTYIEIADIIINGYYEAGPIDIGPYILLYGFNEVEGHRFRVGGRTNESFSKQNIFSGYLAYGTRDRRFKYNLQAEHFLDKDSWTKVGLQVKEDMIGLGLQDRPGQTNNLFAATTQLGLLDRLNLVQLQRAWLTSDLVKGVTQRVFLTTKDVDPRGDFVFSYFTDPEAAPNSPQASSFTTSEITLETRLARKETWLRDGNQRSSLGTETLPVTTLTYTAGLRDWLGSDFNYHKLSISFDQTLKMGALGRGEYKLTGSRIFSPLPYPLLNILPGNETFVRTDATFDMMNFFEFVVDEAVTLRYTHHFEGVLMNRFPLMRKLKLRLVAGGHLAWGRLDDENLELFPETNENGRPVTTFQTLDPNRPYAEVSYGFENLLKFIRVEAYHRLNYLDNPNVSAFGVKGSLYFSF